MNESTESEIKNKGGAPRGNTNAVKHGFYSHSFRRAESKNLETGITGKFEDEIALMRILILRAADKIKDNSDLSLEEYLSALPGVTQAVACLTGVYRTQKVVFEGVNSIEEALEQLRSIPPEED